MNDKPLTFDLYSYPEPRLARHPEDAKQDCTALVDATSEGLKKDAAVNFILGVAIGSTDPVDGSVTFQTGWSHVFANEEARLAAVASLLQPLQRLPWKTRAKLAWAIFTGRQIVHISELQSREERHK